MVMLLSQSRGFRNLVRRIWTVLCRFGLTSKRFEARLSKYCSVTGSSNCLPSFGITAVILNRHPEMIRKFSNQDVEFVVHGYIHIDYKPVSSQEQTRHFKQAIDIFKEHQVPFSGFRAPFLRINNDMPTVLGKLEFLYDSSHVLNWDVIERNGYSPQAWNEYNRLIDFYQARSADDFLALPKFVNGVAEIPVSIPDDEVMVDRLVIKDRKEMTRIWRAILQQTYKRGELFTMQLHPERISFCGDALADILKEAEQLKPAVWIATLGEIAEWWKKKHEFSFQLEPLGDNRYGVTADCSDNATILLKNGEVEEYSTQQWTNDYRIITAKNFVVRSPQRPAIGVALDSSPDAIEFLQSEGYIVEKSEQSENYGLFLNNLQRFQRTDEKPLSESIEYSNAPLLRYWRWPDQAKSALVVTGDIDSITLFDFGLRILETWRQKRR